MTRRLSASVLPKAEEDLIEIASCIGDDSPRATDRFADAFAHVCDLLAVVSYNKREKQGNPPHGPVQML
jgi:plasmid stabilization system protein ParE